jgi:Protein of unknown function (DUF3306)
VSEDLGAKLNRWSQRKLAARRGVTVEEAEEARRHDQPVTPEGQVPAAVPPGADQVAEPAEGEETPVLPPIDELTAESDYTVFLGKNVPQALTNAALRKLWLSDPVFANLDRLNDYDDDYSFVDSVISAVKTSYQVGKGHVDETEETIAKLEPSDADKESDAENEKERASAPADSAAADGESGAATIGNSDAPGDELDAAPRQAGGVKPDDVQSGQAEGKSS